MNEKAPVQKAIDINLEKVLDYESTNALVMMVIRTWEKVRTITADEAGQHKASCSREGYGEIIKSTFQFLTNFAVGVIEQSTVPIREAAFAEGVTAGQDSITRKLNKMSFGKSPPVPAKIDSDALVKSIGEEIRKAFEAGQEASVKAASTAPPRVASARQTIQRDQRSGDILATVINYQYDEAPGISPPPL